MEGKYSSKFFLIGAFLQIPAQDRLVRSVLAIHALIQVGAQVSQFPEFLDTLKAAGNWQIRAMAEKCIIVQWRLNKVSCLRKWQRDCQVSSQSKTAPPYCPSRWRMTRSLYFHPSFAYHHTRSPYPCSLDLSSPNILDCPRVQQTWTAHFYALSNIPPEGKIRIRFPIIRRTSNSSSTSSSVVKARQ